MNTMYDVCKKMLIVVGIMAMLSGYGYAKDVVGFKVTIRSSSKSSLPDKTEIIKLSELPESLVKRLLSKDLDIVGRAQTEMAARFAYTVWGLNVSGSIFQILQPPDWTGFCASMNIPADQVSSAKFGYGLNSQARQYGPQYILTL